MLQQWELRLRGVKSWPDGPVSEHSVDDWVPHVLSHPVIHSRITCIDALFQKESTGLFSQSSEVGQDS